MSAGTIGQIDCDTCGAKAVTVAHFNQCAGPPDYGRCPGCRGKWPLYRGICKGCVRISTECTCR